MRVSFPDARTHLLSLLVGVLASLTPVDSVFSFEADTTVADSIFSNGFEQFTLVVNDYLGQCSISINSGPFTSAPQPVQFGQGTVVSLQATPNQAFFWRYWTGTDGGTTDLSQGTTVTMSADRNVLACCESADQMTCGPTLTVSKSGGGTGTVTSDVAGIDCGADCSENYPINTTVVLTALAASDSSFTGWSGGGCSGTDTCTVTIANAATIIAEFDLLPANLVFVTSTVQDGNLGGIAGADALCHTRASAAALPGTYRAWLSTPTVNAQARLSGARGWIRTDGKPVADQISDITSGHLFYPIDLDENGVFIGEVFVATGTGSDGNYNSGSCNSWTSTLGRTVAGIAANDTGSFTFAGTVACSSPSRLYCFGVDHARVVAPSAVNARRAFVSSAWLSGGGLASADSRCAADAAAASLPGTYKALLATTTASAISRFNTAAETLPWARPDSTLLAPTAALLNSALAYLDATPNSNAANSAWLAGALWTGAETLTAVGILAQTCGNWTIGSAGSTALAGISGYTKVATWRGGLGSVGCDQTYLALVCLQE